jgi:beta-galactosidase
VLARFDSGSPALIAKGHHHYLACWPDHDLLASVVTLVTAKAKLKTISLPDGIRLRRRGELLFVMNYGNRSWRIPIKGELLLGSRTIAAQDVAILSIEAR